MMTGVARPASRSERQTVKPSVFGSITSRTIASYADAWAIHSASSPLAVMSATMPAPCSARRIAADIRRSSSTTSTLIAVSMTWWRVEAGRAA